MVRRMSLLARLVATHALLFSAAMTNTGLAEESGLAPSQSDAKVHEWKKPTRPSTDVRSPHRTSAPSTKADVVRNAIGQPIRTRPPSPASDGRIFTPAAADLDGKTTTNAPRIGPASASGPVYQHQVSVPVAMSHTGTNDAQVKTPMNHSSINGTGMMRPGSGSSTIGGASHSVLGVINGTSFRPKHP